MTFQTVISINTKDNPSQPLLAILLTAVSKYADCIKRIQSLVMV